MRQSFSSRVYASLRHVGPLVVGVDPHPKLLTDLGFADSAVGAGQFFDRVISETAGQVAFYKPQIALFEQYGTAGLVEYARVLENNRTLLVEAGANIIADGKRADIGSSMAGYARAWFDDASDLVADALTINPYLGLSSLKDTFEYAIGQGRGAFILALNSNPESFALQREGSPSLAARVLQELRHTLADIAESHLMLQETDTGTDVPVLSNIGVVVGATVKPADYGLSAADFTGLPILMPGIGAQGGTIDQVLEHFGPIKHQLLINQSRSLFREGMGGLAKIVQTENQVLHSLLQETPAER